MVAFVWSARCGCLLRLQEIRSFEKPGSGLQVKASRHCLLCRRATTAHQGPTRRIHRSRRPSPDTKTSSDRSANLQSLETGARSVQAYSNYLEKAPLAKLDRYVSPRFARRGETSPKRNRSFRANPLHGFSERLDGLQEVCLRNARRFRERRARRFRRA